MDRPGPPLRLILASTSPRRRDLLTEAGLRFTVFAPDADAECGICSGESPVELVARLARQKGENVAAKFGAGTIGVSATEHAPVVVLAADTVANCRGQVLGKPVDEEHARWMLKQLRGTTHQVHTGVWMFELPTGRQQIRVETTDLVMEALDDERIEEHLASDRWIGKAGAFGFQDGNDWLTIVRGTGSNVVGLPIETVLDMLRQWGYAPSASSS